jgi:predicted short-subunit dehydrogenase-like oxidoreductase (DUF2520 family)
LAHALDGSPWSVVDVLGRNDDVSGATEAVDLVVIATPDAAIVDVARAVRPSVTTVVAHLAGSRGLAELRPHPRRAGMHPLVALPDSVRGAERLRSGIWFATAGDLLISELVAELGGNEFTITEEDRAGYHAAAAIASNHLVALLGQAERVGNAAGVPFEALMALVRATVDNVDELGPAAALTGPAARGDHETINRHRVALADDELAAYDALVAEARRLAGKG